MWKTAIRVIIAIVASFMLASCGSGNGANVVNSQSGNAEQEADNKLFTAVDPLFRSEQGMSLIALDEQGLPCAPEGIPLRVEEIQTAADELEWRIIDELGTPRPVYFRVSFPDSRWLPAGLYRDAWGAEAKLLMVPVTTRGGDIDIAAVPLRGQSMSEADCRDKAVARFVFSTDPGKAVSSDPPLDKTGVDEPNEFDRGIHNCLPFIDGTAIDDMGYWFEMDNQAECVVSGDSWRSGNSAKSASPPDWPHRRRCRAP